MAATWNEQFQQKLLHWYDGEKRVLPWRESRDPYRIWVSEIMLQQTRVEAAVPFFERFMQAFPTVEALAAAGQEAVLKQWEGLGYYSRARNLHAAAKLVAEVYHGRVPDRYEEIRSLPGVGDYTAGAVLSIAYNQCYPAVDGNVKRVFSRIFAIPDDVKRPDVKRRIEDLARELIAPGRASDFNQALMELGALICVPGSPKCNQCPVQALCAGTAGGNPARYPVKAAQRKPKAIVRLVAIVRQETEEGERFLLVQNPDGGMLAGLWGFPGIDLTPAEWEASGMGRRYRQRPGQQLSLTETAGEAGEELSGKISQRLTGYLRTELGIEVTLEEQIGEAEYTFTHRLWTMPLWACQFLRATGTGSGPAAAWARPEEFGQYAIPTVYQKVIRAVWGKR